MANFTNCPFANQDPSLRSTNYTKGRVYNKKEYKIDTITLHCVVGHPSLKNLAAVFQGSRKASSNYGVDDNGNVGLFVEEKDRSWCSSSSANDVRAITVEINSDTTAPYAMKDASVNGAIRLCIDVCQRNGIKKMYWYADKETALMKRDMLKADEGIFTVHRWFANKSCPGDFLFNKMGWVCEQVNAALADTSIEAVKPVEPVKPVTPSKKSLEEIAREVIDGKWGNGTERVNRITKAYSLGEIAYTYAQVQVKVNEMLLPKVYWRVQVGAFKMRENCDKLVERLHKKGFTDTYVVQQNGLYKVQLGAFLNESNCKRKAFEVSAAGFDTYIVHY